MNHDWINKKTRLSELPDLLTTKEVSELMGVCKKTLLNWHESGILKHLGVGQKHLYFKHDIEKLLG